MPKLNDPLLGERKRNLFIISADFGFVNEVLNGDEKIVVLDLGCKEVLSMQNLH